MNFIFLHSFSHSPNSISSLYLVYVEVFFIRYLGIWIFKWNRTHIRYILYTKLDLVRQFSLKQSAKNFVRYFFSSRARAITQWVNKIMTEWMNEWMNNPTSVQANEWTKRILCSTFLIYSEWILLTFIFVITQKKMCGLYVCASTSAATVFLLLFCSLSFQQQPKKKTLNAEHFSMPFFINAQTPVLSQISINVPLEVFGWQIAEHKNMQCYVSNPI